MKEHIRTAIPHICVNPSQRKGQTIWSKVGEDFTHVPAQVTTTIIAGVITSLILCVIQMISKKE